MGREELPTMEEYKISLVVEGMERIATGRTVYTKDHIAPARVALDEICRTGDYDFGIRLFKVLERSFTDLREDRAHAPEDRRPQEGRVPVAPSSPLPPPGRPASHGAPLE